MNRFQHRFEAARVLDKMRQQMQGRKPKHRRKARRPGTQAMRQIHPSSPWHQWRRGEITMAEAQRLTDKRRKKLADAQTIEEMF